MTYSRGGHCYGTAGSSSRSSVVGEGIDLGAIAKLRREVLERENQALAARLNDAETLTVKKTAECEGLKRTLDEKDAEDEVLRQRMMELEISHAQRESVEKALETMSASAAEAQAQALEAQAQVLEARAMAAEAEEKIADANARAEAANRLKEEAVAAAKKARAEAAKLTSASPGAAAAGKSAGSPSPPGSSPGGTPNPKPVAADANGGMAGFSPLSAARARADASVKECDQLRSMLNELSSTMRKRGIDALKRINGLEEERDAAEEERDELLGVKEKLTQEIAGMREAAHEAVRQVRLEQVKEQHVAAMRVGEMHQIVANEKRIAAGARAETEAVLKRMGEHLDQGMAARRQMEETREAMKLVKEEAKVLRTIAANLAKEVIEAQERGAASGEIRVPIAPPKALSSPGQGRATGLSGEYWYNPMSGEIKLL